MSTPAVTPAESASAPIVEQEVSLQERLNNATEDEYKVWERTGEIPAVKPKSAEPPAKTEAPAASNEAPKETSAVEADATTPPVTTETAAAPEAVRPQKKRDIDGRVAQLLKERKEADEKWEARFAALESKLPKPQEPGVKTASPTVAEPGKPEPIKATDPEPELGGVNPLTGKPYATIAEWQKTHTAWLRAQVTAELEGKFTQSEQQRAQAEDQRKKNEAIGAKLALGKEKYPDFEKVAFNPDLALPLGSPADEFLRNSENAADVLYYLGQHPEVLQSFYRYVPGKDDKPGKLTGHFDQLIHPTLQTIELAKIEARLTAAAPTPSPTPKPSVTTKPLPPPPTVLSAKGSAAGDAAEEALKKKDFSAWEAEENRRERKGRRA